MNGLFGWSRKKTGDGLIVLGIAGLLLLACVPLIDSQTVGYLHDDGVYAIAAKALAEGKGFTLLHLPDCPAQIKYPILYPLLLAFAWLLNPIFPENLSLMHWLTAPLAIAGIGVLYFYLRRMKVCGVAYAAAICGLIASNFFFLFYATSLMSEAPYFLVSLLAIFVVEAHWQKPSRKWLLISLLLSALAFHVRTIGLVLIGAIGLFLILQKRWQESLLYSLGSLALTVLPWGLWVKGHTPTPDAFNFPLVYVYGGYAPEYGINAPHDPLAYMQAWMDKGIYPLLGAALLLMFPLVSSQLAYSPLVITLFGLTGAVLLLAKGLHSLRSMEFSVSGLYVAGYTLCIAGWMYPGQSLRFLLMVLPWLWLYFFQGVHRLGSGQSLAIRRVQQVALTVFLLVVTAWPAVQGYQLLYRMRSNHWLEPSGRAASLWSDYLAAFDYVKRNTDANARVAGIWDPAVSLYTGRPSFGIFTSALQPINGQVTDESVKRLFNSLRHYQVQYVLDEPFLLNQELKAPFNPVVQVLKNQYPSAFRPVYQSPHQWITIYRLSVDSK